MSGFFQTDPNALRRALGIQAPEPVPQRPPRQRRPRPPQYVPVPIPVPMNVPLNRDQTMDTRYQNDVIARLADTEQRLSSCLQDKQDVKTQLEQRLTLQQLFEANSRDRYSMLDDFFARNQGARQQELEATIGRISSNLDTTNVLSAILDEASEINKQGAQIGLGLNTLQNYQRQRFGDLEDRFTSADMELAQSLEAQTAALTGVFQGLPSYATSVRGQAIPMDVE